MSRKSKVKIKTKANQSASDISSFVCEIPFIIFFRLKEKAGEFERRGIRLSAVCSVSEPLRLGRLQGNHFDIVVRDIKPHVCGGADPHTYLENLVMEAVENVKVHLFRVSCFVWSCLS